jgi:hypothetical protein
MMTTTQSTTPIEQVSFLFSEFLLKRSEIQCMINNIRTPILATGDGLADPNVVHLFDSPEAFEDWARHTRLAAKFAKVDALASGMQAQHRLANGVVSSSSIEGRNSAMVVSNQDLILPADDAGMNATSDIAVVYENANFTGRSHSMGASAMPDLNAMGMFNQIKSLRVSGICLLTDQTWFYGARLYLVGTPLLEVNDLKAWGFNDRAASAIVM